MNLHPCREAFLNQAGDFTHGGDGKSKLVRVIRKGGSGIHPINFSQADVFVADAKQVIKK